jgi:hypothetical protein
VLLGDLMGQLSYNVLQLGANSQQKLQTTGGSDAR